MKVLNISNLPPEGVESTEERVFLNIELSFPLEDYKKIVEKIEPYQGKQDHYVAALLRESSKSIIESCLNS